MTVTAPARESIHLTYGSSTDLETFEPFRFLYSVWKPSHFPTALERHFGQYSLRTFRLADGQPAGVRMVALDNGRPGLRATIFTQHPLSPSQHAEMVQRLRRAYGLDFPLDQFYRAVSPDLQLTEGPIARLHGMRPSCPETLFGILVIAMVLQNTTVQRSQQMLEALLDLFGDRVVFDGQQLQVFCDASRVAAASEHDLRDRCRLGYRAKYLPHIARAFAEGIADDTAVQSLPESEAKALLMRLKGVGPYSAHLALTASAQNTNSINLDTWNRRILSAFLLNHPDASASEILDLAELRWSKYKGLASLYIIEDQYRERPASPLVSATTAIEEKSL